MPTANPTASSPGVRVVKVGPGLDFENGYALKDYAKGLDLTTSNGGEMLIAESYANENIAGSDFSLSGWDVSKGFVLIWRPVPGLDQASIDAAAGANGTSALTVGGSGLTMDLYADNRTTQGGGVFFDNWNLNYNDGSGSNRGEIISFKGYTNDNNHKRDRGIRHCRINVKTTTAVCTQVGESYSNGYYEDCVVVFQPQATGLFFATYGGYSFEDTNLERVTFHRVSGTGPVIKDLFGGAVRDCTFSNLNAPAVTGSVSTGTLINCYSDYPNDPGMTVVAGPLLVNGASDMRPKAGGPLIGKASTSAANTRDVRGNFRGTIGDVGAAMYAPAPVPAAPNITITSIVQYGQKTIVTGVSDSAVIDSVAAKLSAAATPNGAADQIGQVAINGKTVTATFANGNPGSYQRPSLLGTNIGGTGTSTGGDPVTIAVPPLPTVKFTSQTHNGTVLTLNGVATGYPTAGTGALVAAASNPNGATANTGKLTIKDDGSVSVSIYSTSGNYDPSPLTVSNYSGSATAKGLATTLYADGTQPSGYPAVEFAPYAAPAFASPSIANNGAVSVIKLENTAGAAVTNQPFTIGMVFKCGQLTPADSLVGKISGQADLALQFDVKSTWQDGSVRHAAISAVVPSMASGALLPVVLTRSTAVQNTTPAGKATVAGANPQATIVLAGVTYTADGNAALKTAANVKLWLAGPIVTEYTVDVPFKDGSGNLHPFLHCVMYVRAYAGINQAKVDFSIEYADAYLSNPPGDVTYDVTLSVAGATVYTKSGLKHYFACRWKKTGWQGAATAVHVRYDRDYLMDSMMFPNYDRSLQIPQSVIDSKYSDAAIATYYNEPMNTGKISPYMPSTGARPDIGPHPVWAIDWLLSQDKQARKFTLIQADLAGSYPMHLRDRSTGPASGEPLDAVHWPYVTDAGNANDGMNNSTGKTEKISQPGNRTCPNTPDTPHHPAAANMAYMLTADCYYLEEVIFWNSFAICWENPNYRGYEKGLMQANQTRGQAWAMRDIGFAAALVPDSSAQKQVWKFTLDQNLAYYNATYSDNPNAVGLGFIVNGAAFADAIRSAIGLPNSVKPWQDAFFTFAIGQIVEFGFTEAARLLYYKAKVSITMLTDRACRWTLAVPYDLRVLDDNSNFYPTLGDCVFQNYDPPLYYKPVGSQEMLDYYVSQDGSGRAAGTFKAGDMIDFPDDAVGFTANLQIGLAMAVDSGYPNGALAWEQFQSRTTKPDYVNNGASFDIFPRSYKATDVHHPDAPKNVKVTTNGNATQVTWDTPANNGGSVVLDYTITAITGEKVTVSTSPANIVLPSGVKNGLYVTARNAAGSGPISPSSDSFTPTYASTTPTTPPADTTAPVMTGKPVFSSITTTGGRATWTAATDDTGVVGYENSVDTGTPVWVDVGAALTSAVASLLSNTAYTWRVRARDAAGNRSNVISDSFTTLAQPTTGGGTTLTPFTPSTVRMVKVQAVTRNFIAGAFWDMTDPKKPVGSKDPDATIDVTFDWTDWLADMGNAKIASATFVMNGVTSASSYPTATAVSVFVSGGTVSSALASVTCRITTDSNPPRTDDRTVYLKIAEE